MASMSLSIGLGPIRDTSGKPKSRSAGNLKVKYGMRVVQTHSGAAFESGATARARGQNDAEAAHACMRTWRWQSRLNLMQQLSLARRPGGHCLFKKFNFRIMWADGHKGPAKLAVENYGYGTHAAYNSWVILQPKD